MPKFLLALVLVAAPLSARGEDCPRSSAPFAGADHYRLPVGCPSPISGWVYSDVAVAVMTLEREQAITGLTSTAAELRALKAAVEAIPDPPSALNWYLTGLASAAALGLAVFMAGR